jgi:hypothetical protein
MLYTYRFRVIEPRPDYDDTSAEAYISEVKQNSNWTAYIRNLLCKNALLYICQNSSAI